MSEPVELGIWWQAGFVCREKPGFLLKESPRVLDALAETPFWPRFRARAVWDYDEKRVGTGEPLGSLASLKKLVKSGEALYLADDPIETAATRLRVQISASEAAIALRAHVGGEVLRDMGLLALDSFADLIADLTALWRPRGVRMPDASAEPTARPGPFAYPRIRPPRVVKPARQRAAIMDVLDARIADSATHPATSIATRALAIASVPDFVTRRERHGVVIIRWVNDPCSEAEMAAGAAAHERWLYEVLPSTRDDRYNEAGDLRLFEGNARDFRGFDLLTTRGTDHFAHVAADREPVPPVPPAPQLFPGCRTAEMRLLAPSREVALALVEAARSAGYDRVVYRGEDGELWDPAPPGMWAN